MTRPWAPLPLVTIIIIVEGRSIQRFHIPRWWGISKDDVGCDGMTSHGISSDAHLELPSVSWCQPNVVCHMWERVGAPADRIVTRNPKPEPSKGFYRCHGTRNSTGKRTRQSNTEKRRERSVRYKRDRVHPKLQRTATPSFLSVSETRSAEKSN